MLKTVSLILDATSDNDVWELLVVSGRVWFWVSWQLVTGRGYPASSHRRPFDGSLSGQDPSEGTCQCECGVSLVFGFYWFLLVLGWGSEPVYICGYLWGELLELEFGVESWSWFCVFKLELLCFRVVRMVWVGVLLSALQWGATSTGSLPTSEVLLG